MKELYLVQNNQGSYMNLINYNVNINNYNKNINYHFNIFNKLLNSQCF